ncbi:hypothetical protein J2S74_005568 [Evansella vedderi]|uniref:Uncharacterized protein n=1 Tax=Evansella vedderi TaxID=38282 RepID=A0ABU0A3P4_9BACI|nr:hypothetical protein [Evansella vedderi]MDQ0258103.1 hypothetical protein [Evansella vedderi]
MAATANDPVWFFVIFYAILGLTFISAIISLFYQKRIFLSILMIVVIPTHHILAIVSSIGRGNRTEMEHWYFQLIQLQPWALIVLLAKLYIVVWWIISINTYLSNRKKLNTSI